MGAPMTRLVPTFYQAWHGFMGNLELLERSPATLKFYKFKGKPLLKIFGKKLLNQITQRDVDMYIAQRKDVVGAGSINKELVALKTVFNYAEVAPQWKLTKLSHQSKPKFVHPPETVAKLWHELTRPTQIAMGLCLLAGLRAEDTKRADASMVKDRVLALPRTKTGAFTTWLVDTLVDILPKSGKLVTKTDVAVRYELEKTSKALGIDPPILGPGVFRHHCATYAADNGAWSDSDIKAVLGHGKGDVTTRYRRSDQIPLKREILECVERVAFPVED